MNANCILRAITLRGIGSYLHGARLEIRPLTILCGKNGSGKSTWFKMLNTLVRSQRKSFLPFHLDHVDDFVEDIQHTNAFVHLADTEDHKRIPSRAPESEFGPPCTVGLEFEATQKLHLPTEVDLGDSPTSLPDAFLRFGICPAGTRFRFRMADPSHWTMDDPTPELSHLVELQIDGRHTIRFTRKRNDDTYRVACSSSFLPLGSEDDSRLLPLATAVLAKRDDVPKVVDAEGTIDKAETQQIITLAVTRIRQLLESLLDGYHYVSAIRKPHDYQHLSEIDDAEFRKAMAIGLDEAVNRRYVGPCGEATWLLERKFAYNLMRQPALPYTGSFDQSFSESDLQPWNEWMHFESYRRWGPVRRIWDLGDAQVQEAVLQAEQPGGEWERDMQAAQKELRKQIAQLFNSVLPRRNLYKRNVWPQLDDEAQFLVDRGIENLSEDEVVRLNRNLIQSAFQDRKKWTIVRMRHGYLFESFVSFWSQRLTGTAIVLREQHERRGHVSLGDGWESQQSLPNGFLVDYEPHPVSRRFLNEDDGSAEFDDDPDRLTRIWNSCFGGHGHYPQPPRQSSSGFHQIMPFIVQTGLMRQYEIMAVENPEVHLHPSLQLQVAEFLMHQANAGKWVIVETHSDLILRRVIREILSEDIAIGQQKIGIYFANLIGPEDEYHSSSLEPIQFGDDGRISNWPEGFLDDDVRESQRLLDIMYGGKGVEDQDD